MPTSTILLVAAEVLILLVSVYFGLVLRMLAEPQAQFATSHTVFQAVVFAGIVAFTMTATGLYQRDLPLAPRDTLIRISLSFCVALALIALVYSAWPDLSVGQNGLAAAVFAAFVGIASCRLLYFDETDSRFSRRVLVLGCGKRAARLLNLDRDGHLQGVDVVGCLHLPSESEIAVDPGLVVTSQGRSLRALLVAMQVDELVMALDDRRGDGVWDEILDCRIRGFRVTDDTTFFERQRGAIRIDSIHPSDLIFGEGFRNRWARRVTKRLFDIVVASSMLLLFAPVMLIAALAIVVESKGRGPIIFRQVRVGEAGRRITIIKLRSMRPDAERDGVPRWAEPQDSRSTRVGRILRALRIDELPQLINVLKGEMSLVGPRPERPEYVAFLEQTIPYYGLRHRVKPGITGWAQVRYGYGRSADDAREKLQYDLYYLKAQSLLLDLEILFSTAHAVLFGAARY